MLAGPSQKRAAQRLSRKAMRNYEEKINFPILAESGKSGWDIEHKFGSNPLAAPDVVYWYIFLMGSKWRKCNKISTFLV